MSYASNASASASKALEELSEEDIECLRSDLETLGIDGWNAWCVANEGEANNFLIASPKQRQKKKWQQPIYRRRLILSAYLQGYLASKVLYETEYLGPGGSWRETTAAAASAGLRVARAAVPRWPFPEPPLGWKFQPD